MGNFELDFIKTIPLKSFSLPAGDVRHALKNIDEGYVGFGEAYFSSIKAGHIKAWKLHKKMTLNLIVPHGSVDFVFYSEAYDKYRIENIGAKNFRRLVVPPGIWFGFKSSNDGEESLLSNITHDPQEVMRRDLKEINFDWTSL